MKTLIIFYSLDGNTRFVAETLAKELGGDLAEIKTKDELMTKKGFMKYLWGGRMVFQKREPEIVPIQYNIEDYDLLIIGTPVWAWTYAPPLSTFFRENTIHGKKIALYCCHGGGPGNTLERMAEKLVGNTIIGENEFKEPLKSDQDTTTQTIVTWAKKLMKK